MFRHVVMFSWKDGATDEQRRTVAAQLATLPGKIAELRDYHFGPDAGVNTGNADFVVVADFADVDDYLVYRDHPAHRAVIAACITPIVASRTAVQYELG
jgi:hypothetical protein